MAVRVVGACGVVGSAPTHPEEVRAGTPSRCSLTGSRGVPLVDGCVMVGVAGWWLVGGDFGDGGAGGGFVDDCFAGGECGDEGLHGEVVDGAG